MTWVCRFLDSDVASTSRHAATAKADQASNGPSHPANHVCHPSQRPLPCHHHHSHFQHNHCIGLISLSKLTMPYFRQDNSATLAAHPTDNQENPIVFLDINVGGASPGTYSGNRHNQETFFILFFSPQMSTPAASWSSCLPMWFQRLLRTSVFFAPVRRRSRAFTTEALSFTEWSTGWCFFSKSWTWS